MKDDNDRLGGMRGLPYASLEQVSAWRFLSHRVSVAIGRRNVRLVHDPSKNASASLLVGIVVSVLIVGICFIIAWIKPQGQVGTSRIVADRASGAVYVDVDGVMHPALNLASARLISGQPDVPKQVPMSEIRKSPIGPVVGIIGAPNDLTARAPGDTGWALCDQLGSAGSQIIPRTTVLAGLPTFGDWAAQMVAPRSALMAYGGDAFVVTGGRRSAIDLADKAVTLALGLPVGDLHLAPMSRALYEALTPAPPLRVPDVPNPGGPVGYSTPALTVVSGSVLRVADVTGQPEYFVVLPAGVQRVPATAATMILNRGMSGGQVITAKSAAVATLPQAVGFDVSIYPPGHIDLVDKAVEPVTCVAWRKTSGEPRAQVTTISGRRLPIPVGDERRVRQLVQAGQGAADQVYIGAVSANWVQVTGAEPASARAESLWWITDNGVRFGVPSGGAAVGNRTRQELGLTDAPTPAPWAVIRWLPAGQALSEQAARAEHDTFGADPSVVPLPTKPEGTP
jgi:type VII secretion protein EccB